MATAGGDEPCAQRLLPVACLRRRPDVSAASETTVFIVDNAADRVFEAGPGNRHRLTSVSFALAAGQHIEVLSTTSQTGIGAINLSGNELAQRINGNNGANIINGGGGNDIISGLAARVYGAGNDTLTGGAGYDYFVFNTALNASTNVDRITDFNVVQDTIRLENAVMPGLGSALALSRRDSGKARPASPTTATTASSTRPTLAG